MRPAAMHDFLYILCLFELFYLKLYLLFNLLLTLGAKRPDKLLHSVVSTLS